MILFLTGASHTGKTLLAQRLLERYRVPYLSIDHLKMGLIRSGRTTLTPESDCLTDYLWPIVREIIKTENETRKALKQFFRYQKERCYPAELVSHLYLMMGMHLLIGNEEFLELIRFIKKP